MDDTPRPIFLNPEDQPLSNFIQQYQMKLEDENAQSNDNSKKKYQIISVETREQFIQQVIQKKKTIKQAAIEFGIKFSTSKAILQTFKKEGRIGKKKTRQRKPRNKEKQQSLSIEKQIMKKSLKNIPKKDQNTNTSKIKQNSEQQLQSQPYQQQQQQLQSQQQHQKIQQQQQHHQQSSKSQQQQLQHQNQQHLNNNYQQDSYLQQQNYHQQQLQNNGFNFPRRSIDFTNNFNLNCNFQNFPQQNKKRLSIDKKDIEIGDNTKNASEIGSNKKISFTELQEYNNKIQQQKNDNQCMFPLSSPFQSYQMNYNNNNQNLNSHFPSINLFGVQNKNDPSFSIDNFNNFSLLNNGQNQFDNSNLFNQKLSTDYNFIRNRQNSYDFRVPTSVDNYQFLMNGNNQNNINMLQNHKNSIF